MDFNLRASAFICGSKFLLVQPPAAGVTNHIVIVQSAR
jgi:hypothetical protein